MSFHESISDNQPVPGRQRAGGSGSGSSSDAGDSPPFVANQSDQPAAPGKWSDANAPLVVVATAAGAGAGALGGGLGGWLIFAAMNADCGTDGWCSLGAALFGILAGLVIGVLAYIGTGLNVIYRHRQPGRRASAVLPFLASTVAVIGVGLLLIGI